MSESLELDSASVEERMTASLATRSSPCRISTTVWLLTWRRSCAHWRRPTLIWS
uniref:Uncharacterized protein n=1 Tax=Sinocyclocheilus rhinocerous TaxID=307959 RepID=A0A673GXZ9_9TELE